MIKANLIFSLSGLIFDPFGLILTLFGLISGRNPTQTRPAPRPGRDKWDIPPPARPSSSDATSDFFLPAISGETRRQVLRRVLSLLFPNGDFRRPSSASVFETDEPCLSVPRLLPACSGFHCQRRESERNRMTFFCFHAHSLKAIPAHPDVPAPTRHLQTGRNTAVRRKSSEQKPVSVGVELRTMPEEDAGQRDDDGGRS
ncbi:hypothetical protein LXL04_026843 [Taraxacum kok-saghyz]